MLLQALNLQGHLKFLHGQNERAKDGTPVPPQLALFALATPLQPPSILEIRTKNLIFRSKHKLDFTPTDCDARWVSAQRASLLLSLNDPTHTQHVQVEDEIAPSVYSCRVTVTMHAPSLSPTFSNVTRLCFVPPQRQDGAGLHRGGAV